MRSADDLKLIGFGLALAGAFLQAAALTVKLVGGEPAIPSADKPVGIMEEKTGHDVTRESLIGRAAPAIEPK